MAMLMDLALAKRKRHTRGNSDLLLYQVNPRNPFGDGMFNLQTGIHLQEVKVAFGINQELNSPCARIIHGFGCCYSGLPHFLTQLRSHKRRWGFLHNLLVPALDGTLPFEQMNRIAKLIS